MAHDFLGTFNGAMYERLKSFVQAQKSVLQGRINHLNAEINRIGVIQFKYENGVPAGYAFDKASYIGKLLATYEVLGGNPSVDLRVRLLTDPVFLLPGSSTVPATMLNNGEVLGGKGLSDANSGDLIRQYRTAFNSTLQRRFDYLERKIRRAMDYVDQLQAEVTKLTQLLGSSDGSMDGIQAQIEQLIKDPTYRAVTPDTTENAELGRDIYAPFSSYDVPEGSLEDPSFQTNRTAVTTQRQSGNLPPVKPGQSKA